MTDKKIYTAFISSAFQSLRDERNVVIDTLLDSRVMPIGMEHFTVSTNGEFSDIEDLIDDSDFFILLLGSVYGSCDANGVSWTEREYLYAMRKKKPMIAIICDELALRLRANGESLSEDEKKQVAFCRRINFAREATDEFGIRTIVSQFFKTYNYAKCIGWTRIEDINKDEEALRLWRESHKVFDLGGMWYHVHLSEDDESYIRVGTVKIEQEFSPDKYASLTMKGENFSILHYDTAKEAFAEDRMKNSRFVGEYTLKENGEIFGIFSARRAFNGTFGSQDVNRGARRGIHDFVIDVFEEETTRIDGEFHDEAPSPKLGRIFLFRSMRERDAFLLSQRESVIVMK
jgi:hypothetical protein